MLIPADEAEEIVYDEHSDWTKEDESMVDQRRWVTVFEGRFKHVPTGCHYLVYYERGSTECQDADLFGFDKEVQFTHVVQRPVTEMRWVPLEE